MAVIELLVQAYKALVAQSEATSHKEELAAVQLADAAIAEIETYMQVLKPTPVGLMSHYACHNRGELATTMPVQNDWYEDGGRRMIEIPTGMVNACQYTLTPLGLNDARCRDCKHKKV